MCIVSSIKVWANQDRLSNNGRLVSFLKSKQQARVSRDGYAEMFARAATLRSRISNLLSHPVTLF